MPLDDPAVYDMISAADTIGVFQIESRAQMSMLPRLKPNCYYDLVIEVAIVRPGPIQGDMVHPYLRRRAEQEPVEYPNEAVRAVLHKTLGVPIFQEQAMRLAMVAAGFTPDEADQLRRAMAAWRRGGDIDQFHDKLVEGMARNGLSAEFAERVYKQICGFGEYGFPESHAASFAHLVYVSAWLKCHYPAVFCAALVNSQPMGFYAPAQLIRDAREHGVAVRPVDVNHSEVDLTLEPDGDGCAVRLGLRLLAGLPGAAAERIVAARHKGLFTSADDLSRRTRLGRPVMELLSRADALGSLGLDRRAALWESLRLKRDDDRPLFAAVQDEPQTLPIAISPLSEFEEVLADYRSQTLSLRAHPLSFVRAELDRRCCEPAGRLPELNDDVMVRVAGIVLLRQRPATARGITFVTLEDETGVVNLILHTHVWRKYRHVARVAKVWLVDGQLQRQDVVTHVVAARLVDFTAELGPIKADSRDFH
ncbi:MAG: error-prone DNA polymerase [Pirellulales bacterium]